MKQYGETQTAYVLIKINTAERKYNKAISVYSFTL